LIDRYEGQAPCPACFESSGFMPRWHPHTWEEPGWEDSDPTRPCEYCGATGTIDAPLADEFDDDTNDEPGYSAALAAALSWEPVSDAR